ncbi:MAG: universal stress protein [Dehalococcoidia bacterium]|nr:MAG: universal stress protein [Dehalococcoidia bacterium]
MKMLVPLDGSKSSELVLPHVEALAKQRGVEAEVVLIRVLEPVSIDISYPEATNSMVWEPHIKQVTSQLRSEYKQYLTGIEQRLSSSALNVRSEILTGEPAMEIIEFVNKNPINLVVMATHGRSGISRWAYGSVADKVLRRASCPLLLVRVGQAFWWTISS